MASGVVSVGRHRYAVGLYWENSPGRGRVAQIAKEAAAQPGQQADFFAVRPGTKNGRIPQFGLCSGEAGQTSGLPVLSACLASQIPGSWAGAFRLQEGIVVIIVRDDLIVPDGDLFFSEETEARDRLIQEIGFGGLQATYAPEAWSIPGADSIPLTLILNDNNDIKLQRVSIPTKVKMLVGAASAIFLAILGSVWYWQSRIEEEKVAQVQIQEERSRQMRSVTSFGKQQMPPAEYDRVWEKEPPVTKLIEGCAEGIKLVPSRIHGWTMSTMSCNGRSISLTWQRVMEAGSVKPPEGASVSVDGGSATQSVALPGLEKRGPESLKNINDITNRFLLQNWPGNVSRAADDPPPPPPPGYQGEWNPPPAPWVKRSFTLNVPQIPGVLPGYIGDLPGAIVSNMSYQPGGSVAGSSWRVEGVIYENRK
ncbi:MAG: type 4b pilus protein PilO2 [Alphaproteobacteria bacterium]|nr:type 4b pilus protein PilO2 [Alphaproteobacteria bacterium]